MPRNCLAFTVRVSCKIQRIRLLKGLDYGVYVFLVALNDLILHRKPVVRVYRAFFRYKIAHVAVRCQDIEILAQILANGLGFCRRLYNYKVFRHSLTGFLLSRISAA